MLHFLFFISSLFTPHAEAAKNGGLAYICSNPDNEIKITADLSDGKGEKVAVVVLEGSQDIYRETVGKKSKYIFSINSSKTSLLEVRKSSKESPFIQLTIDPETAHKQLASDDEGLKINKMDAHLTVVGLPINDVVVSCLETRWNN